MRKRNSRAITPMRNALILDWIIPNDCKIIYFSCKQTTISLKGPKESDKILLMLECFVVGRLRTKILHPGSISEKTSCLYSLYTLNSVLRILLSSIFLMV